MTTLSRVLARYATYSTYEDRGTCITHSIYEDDREPTTETLSFATIFDRASRAFRFEYEEPKRWGDGSKRAVIWQPPGCDARLWWNVEPPHVGVVDELEREERLTRLQEGKRSVARLLGDSLVTFPVRKRNVETRRQLLVTSSVFNTEQALELSKVVDERPQREQLGLADLLCETLQPRKCFIERRGGGRLQAWGEREIPADVQKSAPVTRRRSVSEKVVDPCD